MLLSSLTFFSLLNHDKFDKFEDVRWIKGKIIRRSIFSDFRSFPTFDHFRLSIDLEYRPQQWMSYSSLGKLVGSYSLSYMIKMWWNQPWSLFVFEWVSGKYHFSSNDLFILSLPITCSIHYLRVDKPGNEIKTQVQNKLLMRNRMSLSKVIVLFLYSKWTIFLQSLLTVISMGSFL